MPQKRNRAQSESQVVLPKLVTQLQAAEALGVTDRTIRQYIATGALPAYRLGTRQIRIKAEDLERLLQRVPTVETYDYVEHS